MKVTLTLDFTARDRQAIKRRTGYDGLATAEEIKAFIETVVGEAAQQARLDCDAFFRAAEEERRAETPSTPLEKFRAATRASLSPAPSKSPRGRKVSL